MNISKICLCAAAMLSISSSCLALETGVYNRLEGDKLYRVTVLAQDGYVKNQPQKEHLEFVALENSAQECYSSVLLRTGDKSYATTSGLITDRNDEEGRNVDGSLKGRRIGYARMGKTVGDFALEELGEGKIRVTSNVGLVKGFGFDGVYTREETFVAASPCMALHALEVVGKKSNYLAIDDVNYQYRVMQKEDGSGYSIQVLQDGAAPSVFDVGIMLQEFNFIWNNQPVQLFKADMEAKG